MPVGGAEDFALGVHRHLSPEVQARFVCLRSLDLLGEEARSRGLPVDLVPVFPTRRVSPLGIWRLAKWLRKEGIQLVHSQTHHAHLYGVAAARLAGIPSIVHQQKTLGSAGPRKDWLLGICLRGASAVVALSDQTRDDIAKKHRVPGGRIHVVPNAIDTDVFGPPRDRSAVRKSLGLPESARIAGTIASLHPVKNHQAIIEALAMIPPADRPQFVFAGDGVARSGLESFAAGLGVHIHFAGRQRPVAPWFQALDLFVLASHWEGQPLAMLQALSCRLPVLASRIEGNTAILGDSHPGLFDPKNPAALARLLRQPSAIFEAPGARVPSCRDAAALLKGIYQSLG